jgi:hypothetical protein
LHRHVTYPTARKTSESQEKNQDRVSNRVALALLGLRNPIRLEHTKNSLPTPPKKIPQIRFFFLLSTSPNASTFQDFFFPLLPSLPPSPGRLVGRETDSPLPQSAGRPRARVCGRSPPNSP